MNKSKHVSKIDIRRADNGFSRCIYGGMENVRCAIYHNCDPKPDTQYICECKDKKPAPQSRGDNNE